MKKLLLILLLGTLFACKKKTEDAQPESPNNVVPQPLADSIPTNTTGNKKIVYPIANLDTTKAYDFSMIFFECNYDFYLNDVIDNSLFHNSTYGIAGILNGQGKSTDMGKVWINDSLLRYSATDQYYICPRVNMNNGNRFRWKLAGTLGFSAQEFDMPISLPDNIKLITILPDTVDSSQPFVLQISEPVANADSTSFSIYATKDGVVLGIIDHFKKAVGYTSSSFSPNDLAYIKKLGGETVYLNVSGYRYHYGMLGARKVLYVTQRSALKQIFIK